VALHGGLEKGTRWSAFAGRAFGGALIVGGFLSVGVGDGLGGLWLAFIGCFVPAASETELNAMEARAALGGVRVRDVMVAEPVTVDPDLSLERFIDDVFFPTRHTAYPVARDGEAIGLMTFRDARRTPRDQWDRVRVRDLMLPAGDALVVDADRDLGEVVPELAQSDLRRGSCSSTVARPACSP